MGEEKMKEEIKNVIELVEEPEMDFEIGELHILKQLLDNSQFKGSDAKFIFNLSNKVESLMEKAQAKNGNGAITMPDGFIPEGMQRV